LALSVGALATSACAAEGSAKPGAFAIVKTYADGDAFWDNAVFDAAANRLFVGRENGVTTVDIATGKVTDQLVLGKQVHTIVLLDKGRARATEGAAADAMMFKRDTGEVLARIKTGKKPDGAALDPATGVVVIMDGITQDAVFADPETGKVVGRL